MRSACAQAIELLAACQEKSRYFSGFDFQKLLDLAPMPTNLHLAVLEVADDDGLHPTRVYPSVTMGAPSAHALGFKGVGDCIMCTVRDEGFRALYKGLSVPLSSQIALQALVFGSYGAAMRALSNDASNDGGDDKNNQHMLMAGLCAGLFQSPATTAVENVKIKL